MRRLFSKGNAVFISLLLVVGVCLIRPCEAAVEAAGSLLVDLDARDASAGSGTWVNDGLLGDFAEVGDPILGTIGGQAGVYFDGVDDAYRGPSSVVEIEGNSDRSIEIWVYNPSVDSDEETMVAWGRRGANLRNLGFNYGRSGSYGAVTHFGNDLGWGTVPSPGRWRHLVYTYDGTTARVYDNSLRRNNGSLVLNTFVGDAVNIAVQNGADGEPLFVNEYNGSRMAGSLWIGALRIHSEALSEGQILNNYEEDAERFGAVIPDDLLGGGFVNHEIGDFNLRLVNNSQTVASLGPKGDVLDFTPGDRLESRSADSYYHLGDVNFRVRRDGGDWESYSTATARAAVASVSLATTVSSADLSNTMNPSCPLKVKRHWMEIDGRLTLRFTLENPGPTPVEIGGLGFPMIFNNILSGRSLDEAHETCSFHDPYIGKEAGYLQVIRLSGEGPVLLVAPEPGTGFEAYRPLDEDLTGRGISFEGFYEWMPHSLAYGENEWSAAEPWNVPTSRILDASEAACYRLSVVDQRPVDVSNAFG